MNSILRTKKFVDPLLILVIAGLIVDPNPSLLTLVVLFNDPADLTFVVLFEYPCPFEAYN